jgi:hypothetical protein
MKTWLLCESCIHTETLEMEPRDELIQKCRACANSCFTVVCRIINNYEGLEESILICLLNCRECIEICEKNEDAEHLLHCADVCKNCAGVLKPLLIPGHLN